MEFAASVLAEAAFVGLRRCADVQRRVVRCVLSSLANHIDFLFSPSMLGLRRDSEPKLRSGCFSLLRPLQSFAEMHASAGRCGNVAQESERSALRERFQVDSELQFPSIEPKMDIEWNVSWKQTLLLSE